MGFPVRQDYLMEEYLSGQEFSVELFLNKDKVAFIEVTEKHISKPPFFVELMHVFLTSVDTQYKKQIISVAYKAAQSLGFHNGPLHIEIKLTTSGPRIVEVNGRPGGDSITSDLIKDAYGINIFEKTIELYLNQDVSITKLRNMSAGIRFIFAPKDGIFKGIDGLNSLKEQNGFKRYEIEKKFGTFVREPTNSDDRLGYYIVEGNSSLELKSKIEEMNKLVTVNIES